MDTPGPEYGDYGYPDHDSGWDDASTGQMKFMAWALVLLVLAFVAFGLLVRWTSEPPAAGRYPGPTPERSLSAPAAPVSWVGLGV